MLNVVPKALRHQENQHAKRFDAPVDDHLDGDHGGFAPLGHREPAHPGVLGLELRKLLRRNLQMRVDH
eukprot:Skav214462  [mRNA]  locus=scaffold1870:212303:214800:- [translate_table: standard]